MARRTSRIPLQTLDDGGWQLSLDRAEQPGDILGLSQYNTPLMRALLSIVCASIMFYGVLPQQLAAYHLHDFVSRADSLQLELLQRMSGEIYTHTYLVKEGRDKPVYVAKVKNMLPEKARQVPLRTDTVREWRLGQLRKSVIEYNVTPPYRTAYLILNDDTQKQRLEFKEDCAKDTRTPSKTLCAETGTTHEIDLTRKAFDQVHNISSLYEPSLVNHTTDEAPSLSSSLQFLKTTIENGNRYWIFVHEEDGIETLYYFDAESHILAKRVITLIEGNARYEMAELVELGHTFLPPQASDQIFDPREFAYTKSSHR